MVYEGFTISGGKYMGFDVSALDFSHEHKTQCPKCAVNGRDRSHNKFHIYDPDGEGKPSGGKCWNADCDFRILSAQVISELSQGNNGSGSGSSYKLSEEERMELQAQQILQKSQRSRDKALGKALTQQQAKAIWMSTGDNPKGWRGLSQDTCKDLRVRFRYDEESGDPTSMLVPVFMPKGEEGEKSVVVGYKVRVFPKDFTQSVGAFNTATDLIGMDKFHSHNKTLLVFGGEIDWASAYQMYKSKKPERYIPAMVTSTLGEGGTLSHFLENPRNYNFFMQFEKVVLVLDSDEAGMKAMDEFAEKMPREKLHRVQLRYKDPNEYLVKGKIQEFIDDVEFKAKACHESLILGSGNWREAIDVEVSVEKLSLPPFLAKLQKAFKGGFPMGRIITIGASSSAGKTTLVNSMIYYWLSLQSHKVGIVSLELTFGQYCMDMLSRHVGRKIDAMESTQDQKEFLAREDVIRAGDQFFYNQDGTDRFHVVDNRDSNIEQIQLLCEQMVIQNGVQVLILDPVSDLTQKLDLEKQIEFASWQKNFVKKHNVLMIQISHVRKSGNGQKDYAEGAVPSENDLLGSYAVGSSSACTIMLARNKMSENDKERNTTGLFVPKCRWSAVTGHLDDIFYDVETHRLHNLEQWEMGIIEDGVQMLPHENLDMDGDDVDVISADEADYLRGRNPKEASFAVVDFDDLDDEGA